MAVAVSRDLTVQVLEDVNVVKLNDRQQALRTSIQKGDPKSLGVSQVMLGLMVMSYSIPLHLTMSTEVVNLGVPWWSGLMFITAGVVAIILDKHCTMKILQLCLVITTLSAVLSLVAVIIYSVDMGENPDISCPKTMYEGCSEKQFAMNLSRGVKLSLLLFTLAEMVISAVLCFLLMRQKRSYAFYDTLSEAAPSSTAELTPSNQD